jgi:hypothetical protein
MLRTRALAAGLALAVGMGAATAALGPAVYASAGVPAATGSFRSWHAAQQAAGFRLRHPTRRHGLTRSGKIVVARCMVTGRLSKRQVFAAYGQASHRFLELVQNNSGAACGDPGEAKQLGIFRIHGARGTLFGICGAVGLPSCHKRHITLFLTWRKHHIFYQAFSHNERRHTLLNFARSLKPVS